MKQKCLLFKKKLHHLNDIQELEFTDININNYISHVLKDRKDLIGKRFIRKKILAKDLDIVNFSDGINPFGISSFKTYIAYDKFLINLKKSENKDFFRTDKSFSKFFQ